MNKERVKEILQSKGVINVLYKNNPVWIESISTDRDGVIQVRNLKTDETLMVDIKDLKD
ncbi:MAG: H-type small acid-soluble spore protein [Clostridiaceae bacterium]|nr:H-type small acid-soluble spore protein [Clostridiaceae bacterium]